MTIVLFYWGVLLSQVILGVAMVLITWRLLKGPRAQDRVMALDALYAAAMMLFITFGIRSSSTIYFEAALVIGLLGFVSSVALAKFLMRGEVIE